jgi:PilZ domain-containing protein
MENRRRHERVPGPFDGRRIEVLVTPVSIYDLSEGGCFINAMHDQKAGVVFGLEIDLPHVGCMAFTAETLGTRSEFGFAVRFIDMSFEDTLRLQKAIDKLMGRVF